MIRHNKKQSITKRVRVQDRLCRQWSPGLSSGRFAQALHLWVFE